MCRALHAEPDSLRDPTTERGRLSSKRVDFYHVWYDGKRRDQPAVCRTAISQSVWLTARRFNSLSLCDCLYVCWRCVGRSVRPAVCLSVKLYV